MNHIVYISPNSDFFDHYNAILHEAETKNQADLLKTLAHDENVNIFKKTKDFILAFNDNTISDQGHLLLLNDGLNGKDYLVTMLKRLVRQLQTNNAVPNDADTIEIPTQSTSILPLFPAYAVIRNPDNGSWCEDKIQKITLRRNNILLITLENGITLNAASLFIENLRTLHDLLNTINPRDNTLFQAIYEQNDCGYSHH